MDDDEACPPDSASSSSDEELPDVLPPLLVSSLAGAFSTDEVEPSLVVHPDPDDSVVACSSGVT